MSAITSRFFQPRQIFILAIALAVCSFTLLGRTGINLADEGFLWYGVQQTARGEIPLRDFQSYEPGRYYWSAAGSFLFGQGVLGLRFSETIFQIIGLWAGLMAATRVARTWAMLVAIGAMLTIWMFPSYKLFDHSLLLCGIWFATRMVEEPSSARIFGAGLFTGLCVFFGRNHGLYNLLAQGFLLLVLYLKVRPRLPFSHLIGWIGGIAFGLIPIVGMLLFVPGFARSYVESVLTILQHGTNLNLSVPWPWRGSLSAGSVSANQFLLGILFVALPLGYFAALSVSFFLQAKILKGHPLFVACIAVGLFYMNHAFSHPDLSHVVQSIHPFTLATVSVVGFFAERKRYPFAIVAIWIGLGLFFLSRQPACQRWVSPAPWKPYASDDKIFVSKNTQSLIDCVRQFGEKNLAPHDGVLIAPFLPGLYPIIKRESPVWDLAFYFPASTQRQNQMVRMLEEKNVDWAIISDTTPGNREDLRLSVTHERLWQYLTKDFELFDEPCLPRSMKILHRKQGRSATY